MALGQDFLGLLDHDPAVQRGIGEHQLIDQFLRSQRAGRAWYSERTPLEWRQPAA
jgi:hypothetical protein